MLPTAGEATLVVEVVEGEMDGEEERSEAGGALVLGEVVLGKVRG